jgi:hypothetical protein
MLFYDTCKCGIIFRIAEYKGGCVAALVLGIYPVNDNSEEEGVWFVKEYMINPVAA